jgi:hypothetical protein
MGRSLITGATSFDGGFSGSDEGGKELADGGGGVGLGFHPLGR